MQIYVNDEVHHPADGRLPTLLSELDADPERVVVVINGAVVPREQRASHVLHDQDRVDVFTFAGGG